MRRARFTWGTLALVFLVVDLWGSYQSGGWFKHWMSSYGHDVLLPIFLYFFNRAIWHRRVNRRLAIALFVFLGATALEFAQLGRLYSGTFDWLDLVAYGVGVTLAVGIDSVAGRPKALCEAQWPYV